MPNLQTTLAEWLVAVGGCHDVKPVTVKIGRQSFEGALYFLERDPIPGAANQEAYVVEAMYLLGELPASYRRSRRVLYRMPGDDRDWFVASWCSAETASSEEYGRFHYGGGAHFLLMPWTVPGAPDSFDETPYRQMAAEVS